MIGTRAVFLRALDHLRQLEAGHARHPDVEDQQGELLGHEREQRLVGGLGAHQPVARRVEQRSRAPSGSSARRRRSGC